ncbi:hypothetical protein GCM10022419_062370 [Nonomuraea rosea]|uniref:Uncharacterized protein n=1 Tax=Nonomuraea rosea TaxID=638574 RepID=A0ABP6XZD5_9ACTN
MKWSVFETTTSVTIHPVSTFPATCSLPGQGRPDSRATAIGPLSQPFAGDAEQLRQDRTVTFGQIDTDPQPPLSAPEQHDGVVRPLPERRLPSLRTSYWTGTATAKRPRT